MDVNVWLALAGESHVHHSRARRYWDEESGEQIAFTRVTMLGFVRLLTNRAAMNNLPMSAPEVWQDYHAFRALPEVIWIGELDDDAHATDALRYVVSVLAPILASSSSSWSSASGIAPLDPESTASAEG